MTPEELREAAKQRQTELKQYQEIAQRVASQRAMQRAVEGEGGAKLDVETGPGFTASLGAAVQNEPEGVLETVQSYFPDARRVWKAPRETVVDGIPHREPGYNSIVFTHPETKALTAFDATGVRTGNVMQTLGELVPTAVRGVGQAFGGGYGAAKGMVLGGPAGAVAGAALGTEGGDRAAMWGLRAVLRALGVIPEMPDPSLEEEGSAALMNLGGGAVGQGVFGPLLNRLAGPQAARARALAGEGAETMGKPQVLDDLTAIARETGRPEDSMLSGAAPLVTNARELQGKAEALLKNPKAANLFRKATDDVKAGIADEWDNTLAATGGSATTRAEAGGMAQADIAAQPGKLDAGWGRVQGATGGKMDTKTGVGTRLQNRALESRAAAQRTQEGYETLWRQEMGGGTTRVSTERTQQVLEAMKAEATVAGRVNPDLFPPELERLLKDIQSSPQGLPLDYLRKVRTELGERGGFVNKFPSKAPEASHIYGTLTGDLEEASRMQGPSALAAFEQGQTHWATAMKREKMLAAILRTDDAAQAFDAAFTGSARGGTLLREVRQVAGPELWPDMVRLKLEQMATKNGHFDLDTYLKGVSGMAEDSKKELFDAIPGLRKELDRLAMEGQDWLAKAPQLGPVANATAPEAAFATAWRSADKGPSMLEAVKRDVSPDTWNDLVRVRLAEEGTTKGAYDGGKFNRWWNKQSPDTRNVIAAPGTDLRRRVDRLLRLSDAEADTYFMRNFPNTASAIEFQQGLSKRELKDRFIDLATWPLRAPVNAAAEGLGLTAEAKARLMMNPKFVKWLADSAKYPLDNRLGWTYHLGRLGGIATAEGLEGPVMAYLDGLQQPVPPDNLRQADTPEGAAAAAAAQRSRAGGAPQQPTAEAPQ